MYVWRQGPDRLRAVLIDQRDDRDMFLEALLFDKGLTIVDRFPSFNDAALLKSLPECDLVVAVVGAELASAHAGLKHLTDTHPRPVLAICDGDDAAHISALYEAGVTSILSIGMGSDRVLAAANSAIAAYDQIAGLKRQVETAQRDLVDRKKIERAKGILMQQRGISEPEAFRELQQTSMRRNESLPAVADTIIAAKELLG